MPSGHAASSSFAKSGARWSTQASKPSSPVTKRHFSLPPAIPDRMASFDFGDLPDYRPDGAGGRRDDDSLSRLRLTNFQNTNIRRHPWHAEHAERRRDRRRHRIEFAQPRAI